MRKNISVTDDQWLVAEELAAEDAVARRDPKANVSRTLMDLALAERKRRDEARRTHSAK